MKKIPILALPLAFFTQGAQATTDCASSGREIGIKMSQNYCDFLNRDASEVAAAESRERQSTLQCDLDFGFACREAFRTQLVHRAECERAIEERNIWQDFYDSGARYCLPSVKACELDSNRFMSTSSGCLDRFQNKLFSNMADRRMNYSGAAEYCATLNTGEGVSWRLPTREELLNLSGTPFNVHFMLPPTEPDENLLGGERSKWTFWSSSRDANGWINVISMRCAQNQILNDGSCGEAISREDMRPFNTICVHDLK